MKVSTGRSAALARSPPHNVRKQADDRAPSPAAEQFSRFERLKQYVPEVRACRRAASHITNRPSRHVRIASAAPAYPLYAAAPEIVVFCRRAHARKVCAVSRVLLPPCASLRTRTCISIVDLRSFANDLQWRVGLSLACESRADAGERSCIAQRTS
jgi:hypothetical protein